MTRAKRASRRLAVFLIIAVVTAITAGYLAAAGWAYGSPWQGCAGGTTTPGLCAPPAGSQGHPPV